MRIVERAPQIGSRRRVPALAQRSCQWFGGRRPDERAVEDARLDRVSLASPGAAGWRRSSEVVIDD
jgi:hypothetical protein